MGHGDTFSFTFTTSGAYAYHCSRHLSMTGTVIVESVVPEFSSTALLAIGLLALFLAVVGIRGKRWAPLSSRALWSFFEHPRL
ncbi:MAG: cupredoxin domain-containing protein [Thermoplasmata archaeon]